MTLDVICIQWETRGDVLVIKSFNQKTLALPSPYFKDICERRRCHRRFCIILLRRWPLPGHTVSCGSGVSNRICKASLIIFPNHKSCWGTIANRTACAGGIISTKTVSISRTVFICVVSAGGGASIRYFETILTIFSNRCAPSIVWKLCAGVAICKTMYRIHTGRILAMLLLKYGINTSFFFNKWYWNVLTTHALIL